MALLRKYEGRFRRHEVNTDMEDYSKIYFTDIFYFWYHESAGGVKARGEISR